MENQQLIQRIEALEKEINNLKTSTTIPIEIVNAFKGVGFLKYESDLIYYGGASGSAFYNIFAEYSGKKSLIAVSYGLKQFVADASTDVCTSIGNAHGFADGNQVILYSTDTLPGGLDTVSSYYVMNSTATTFKLSLDNINPVDITSAGTGTHYAEFLT